MCNNSFVGKPEGKITEETQTQMGG